MSGILPNSENANDWLVAGVCLAGAVQDAMRECCGVVYASVLECASPLALLSALIAQPGHLGGGFQIRSAPVTRVGHGQGVSRRHTEIFTGLFNQGR